MNIDNSHQDCLGYYINHTTGPNQNIYLSSVFKKVLNFKIPTPWNKDAQFETLYGIVKYIEQF